MKTVKTMLREIDGAMELAGWDTCRTGTGIASEEFKASFQDAFRAFVNEWTVRSSVYCKKTNTHFSPLTAALNRCAVA